MPITTFLTINAFWLVKSEILVDYIKSSPILRADNIQYPITKFPTTLRQLFLFLYFFISSSYINLQTILMVAGIEYSILNTSVKNINTRFFSWVTSAPMIVFILLLSFFCKINDHWLFVCYSSLISCSLLLLMKLGKFILSLIPKNLIRSALIQFLFLVRIEVVVLILESFFRNASL